MVIPKIRIMIFAGRSILCVIKLSSINGDAALLSKMMNKAKDPIDKKAKDTTIVGIEFVLTLLLLLFPMYVRVSRKEAITTAKVMAPFTSRLRGILPLVPTPSWSREGDILELAL
jgi:hypothetical protein